MIEGKRWKKTKDKRSKINKDIRWTNKKNEGNSEE